MSLSTIDQSTGNATVISGNVNDKVGNLGALTTTDKSSAVGAINEVKSGLTKQVTNSVTLPTTTNGITSAQIETSVPSGAHIIGGCISNVSTYSDAVAIGVYYYGNYARVTCVSPVDTTLPSITLNLITTYTV